MTNKVPNIRFKGFTDDWEQRKLREVADKTYGGGTPKTSIEEYWQGNIPWIQSQDLSENKVFGVEPRKYINQKAIENSATKIIPKNSIAIITRVGVGKLALMPISYCTSQDFLSLSSLKINELYATYVIYKMLQIEKEKVQGTSIKGITSAELLSKKIDVPIKYAEQQKIGEYFSNLDHLITLYQRKCEQTKELKKFMLQKMFPKKGEKNPEIRFPGFTDDWEQRKLSSGLREYTDRVIVEDDKEYYQISVRNNFGGITLRGSKMGNKIGRKRQAKINLTKYPQTLIFTRQTVEQGGIGWVEKYCDGAIVTENMPTISLDTSVFSKYFLTNLFQTKIFYQNAILDNIEGGSAQIAIHESKFLSSTLLFPNLDEQEKIGSFFKQIDETITLHQRKCEQLKELKKFMLQNMFPKKG